LLAEAWERLERERIDATGAEHASAAHRSRATDRAAPHSSPAPPPQSKISTSVETANPVTETILRQFQTLCGDVRRTTNARCSPR
jgi:hypothetical protein